MKRVLLTGIAGFFGSHMLRHLLVNTDWHISGIASWRHSGCPERIIDCMREYPGRVFVATHDLEAPVSKQTRRRIGDIDYIINAAAESHVDRSIADPGAFIRNNTNVALNVMELARQCKPQAAIQFSTDEVYGVAPVGVDHAEWSPIVPSNPYSASKACQEAIAISYWRTYGVPVVITNTMNLIGEMQDSEKYVAMLIRRIAAGEKVTVHGAVGNIGSRYYLHARNAADAVLYILRNLPPVKYPDAERPDRYNVVGDQEIDNLTLAQMVASVMEKPLDYELVDFHATRPGHDRRYALDGKKLREAGWKAPIPFEQSLRRTIQWTASNSAWL